MRQSCCITAALLGALLASGCGGGRRPLSHAQGNDSFVQVRNNHHLDVVVYVVRGGVRFRVGDVRSFSTDTLALSRSIVGGTGEIRLMVDPIGSPNVHMTEPMTIGPSRWVDLSVASPLRFSFFSLWYR